ncbi:MAG: hypothetical protein QOE93_85 [Actinomycetota bacterium]|nr:hypothetical protein [Actinomycetota bacterium]
MPLDEKVREDSIIWRDESLTVKAVADEQPIRLNSAVLLFPSAKPCARATR